MGKYWRASEALPGQEGNPDSFAVVGFADGSLAVVPGCCVTSPGCCNRLGKRKWREALCGAKAEAEELEFHQVQNDHDVGSAAAWTCKVVVSNYVLPSTL